MSKPTVLVVEDEPIIAADIVNQLTKEGYKTVTTDTGEEALRIVSRQCPSVVLMDIQLAGKLDGIATASEMAKIVRVPLIYLTSNFDDQTFDRARRTMPHSFLSKPFRIADVVNSIELALKREKINVLSDSSFLASVDEIVLAHLSDDKFSLNFLAREVGLSRSQLYRKIKEETDMSTSLYIRSVKLNHARDLLLKTNDTIAEVAFASGFDSPQNFSKYFHDEYGASPSVFRLDPRERLEQGDSVDGYSDEPMLTPAADPPLEHILVSPEEKSMSDRWLYALLILILVLSIFAYKRPNREAFDPQMVTARTPISFQNSIAVLPFDVIGDAQENVAAEGIVEEILTSLSHFKELKVISRTSSSKFKDSNLSLSAIARALDVAYILEGSVRIIDDQMMITAQLIDARKDEHIWAQNYALDQDNLFAIQAKVAREIAQSLNQEITGDLDEMLTDKREINIEAYNFFQIGSRYQQMRTEESLLLSIDYFKKALVVSPKYANALAHMAASYNLLGNIGYRIDERAITKTEIYALEAISIDPSNGFAYAVLGIHYMDQRKWAQSKSMFELGLRFSPNNALCNYWYSLLLRNIGEYDQSVFYSAKASELDPLYPVIHAGHIVNCLYADEVILAKQYLDQDREKLGDSFLFLWAEAKYFEKIEEYANALSTYQQILAINPTLEQAKRGIAFSSAMLGDMKTAQNFLDEPINDNAVRYFSRASIYDVLGDRENTIKNLLAAFNLGYVPSDMMTSPLLAKLKDDPRIAQAMIQYNLNYIYAASEE